MKSGNLGCSALLIVIVLLGIFACQPAVAAVSPSVGGGGGGGGGGENTGVGPNDQALEEVSQKATTGPIVLKLKNEPKNNVSNDIAMERRPARQAEVGTLGDRCFSWACVFSKQPVALLEDSLAGILVIDPDAYKASEVARLHQGGRLVLAYLSVGEAEAYRSYFSGPAVKSLLITENPDWPGNFRVKYWEPAWADTLKSYGESILRKGFDGFFCDVVDAWEDYPDNLSSKDGNVPPNRPDGDVFGDLSRRTAMEDLLVSFADGFRNEHPGLVMILQNSHELFANPLIFSNFQGITQEGIYESWSKPLPMSRRKEKLAVLRSLRSRGKFVGLLEYTRKPFRMRKIKEDAVKDGFVPYFSTRELDTIFPIP